jgi:hypothetical protein
MSDIVTKQAPAPPRPPIATGGRPGGSLDANLQFRVRATTLEGQKKRGEVWSELNGQRTSSAWLMLCDEGDRLGGSDSAPSPLAYFSAAIAF